MNIELLKRLEETIGDDVRGFITGRAMGTNREDDDWYLWLANQCGIAQHDLQYFLSFQEHMLSLTKEINSSSDAEFLAGFIQARIQARCKEIAERPAGE